MNEEELIELVFRPKSKPKKRMIKPSIGCPVCGNIVIVTRLEDGKTKSAYKCGYSRGHGTNTECQGLDLS